jgi:L-ascorbate metabolism protein UlaG (beta-lactamase superfamily)
MPPFASLSVPPGRVGVHWFGQNSFALKAPGGTTILLDPYFPWNRPAEKYLHPEPPVRESELPAQAIFLTHDHSDHTHPETLLRIRRAFPDCFFVGPPESFARFSAAIRSEPRSPPLLPSLPGEPAGPGRFIIVRAGESCEAGEFAAHFALSKPPGGDPEHHIAAPEVLHLGVVFVVAGLRLYFSGDAIRTFAELDELVAPVRRLAPQAGFLTCHPTEGEFPDFPGCARMAQRLGLRIAFPSHYDCFVKRTYDPRAWAAAFAGAGIETRIIPYNQAVLFP